MNENQKEQNASLGGDEFSRLELLSGGKQQTQNSTPPLTPITADQSTDELWSLPQGLSAELKSVGSSNEKAS